MVVIVAREVVDVPGADDRAADLPRDLDDPLVALVLQRDLVLLDLEVDVVAPDRVHQVVDVLARLVRTVVAEQLAEARGQAAGERDDPLAVGRELRHVDRRLAPVVAIDEALGGELGEVRVAGLVLGQQRQVVALDAPRAALGVIVDDVQLAADQRLDAVLLGGLVELDRAVHHAVVGEPERGLVERGGTGRERVDLAGTVEQRVLGVDVEVGAGGRHQRLMQSRQGIGRLGCSAGRRSSLRAVGPGAQLVERSAVAGHPRPAAAGAAQQGHEPARRTADRGRDPARRLRP